MFMYFQLLMHFGFGILFCQEMHRNKNVLSVARQVDPKSVFSIFRKHLIPILFKIRSMYSVLQLRGFRVLEKVRYTYEIA